jgi:hypothetical protein
MLIPEHCFLATVLITFLLGLWAGTLGKKRA